MKSVCNSHIVKICIIAAGFVLLIIGQTASAKYFNDDPPTLNTTGELNVVGGITARVEKRLTDGEWSGDSYDLVIRISGTKDQVVFPFESTYGRFRLYMSGLTGSSMPEVILITASGRGTSATSYSLDIYRIDGSKLVKIYDKLIAEYYGPGEMWWYDVDFEVEKSGLSEIMLSLENSPPSHSALEDLTLIPKVTKLKVSWDVTNKKVIEAP